MTGANRPALGGDIGNEIAQLSVWEMIAAVVIVTPLFAGMSLRVDRLKPIVLSWLARRDVLVGSALVDLPGADGLGLDLNRLLVAVGLAGLAVWVASQAVRSRRLRSERAELGSVSRQ